LSDWIKEDEAEFEERKKTLGTADAAYHMNFSQWMDAEEKRIDKLWKDLRERGQEPSE
jgi:predicted DNA-binding protein (MmcQ/YjbR family)